LTESSKNNLFSKKFRLRSKTDFDDFFILAKPKTLGSIKIFYAKSKNDVSRLGIAISGKHFNSIQRNSLKRLIREFFRTSKDQFFMIDVVVTVRYSSNLSLDWKSFLAKVKIDLSNILVSINNNYKN
jgi:ribonuclease P protein component